MWMGLWESMCAGFITTLLVTLLLFNYMRDFLASIDVFGLKSDELSKDPIKLSSFNSYENILLVFFFLNYRGRAVLTPDARTCSR